MRSFGVANNTTKTKHAPKYRKRAKRRTAHICLNKNKQKLIMKKLFITLIIVAMNQISMAQSKSFLPKAAFISLDIKGLRAEYKDQGNAIMSLELQRVNKYELMDNYDLNYLASENKIDISDCFGQICLVEIGKALGVDKMVSGSIESIGDNLVIVLRIIDVKEGRIEKSMTNEFLNIPNQLRSMLQISVNNLFNIENPSDVVSKLTKKDDHDNLLNNPYDLQLRSDGPRMGVTVFSGDAAEVISNPEAEGGYGGYPFMFQFGYQFEKMYLNEGNFQALFEFIPMITGLDQGLLIPSFTFLNGLRNNSNGWELAFGPTFSVTRKTYGFHDPDTKKWVKVSNSQNYEEALLSYPNAPETLIHRLDKRGMPTLATGFLIAAGKTFKSGKLNLPVNAYIIPSRDNFRFGVSIGFNSRKRTTFFENQNY